MLRRVQPWLAWLLVVFIFYLLFRETPPGEVWRAFLKADLVSFIALATLYFIVIYLIDSASMVRIFRFHAVAIPFSRFLLFRGHSYYFAALNYNAGQGLLAYYIKQAGSASWLTVGGVVFYVMLNDFFVLLLAVSLSFLFAPQTSFFLQSVGYSSIAGLLGLALLLLSFKLLPNWIRPLKRRMTDTSWYGFMVRYGWKPLLLTFLYRLALMTVIIGGLYLPFFPFHLHVPFLYYLAAAPLVLIVGALPITPSGLGTVQSVFIFLFSKQVASPLLAEGQSPDSLLFALVLTWTVANLLLKFAVGFYFHLRRSTNE